MKIGIISMHRVKNYGSFLQAYSLMKMIEKCNCETPVFFDFTTKFGIVDPVSDSLASLKKSKIRYALLKVFSFLGYVPGVKCFNVFLKYRNLFNFYKAFGKKFDRQLAVYLHITDRLVVQDPSIDLLVIGSDEVFNYKSHIDSGYSLELFGENCKSKNMISFAGSFGYTTFDDIESSIDYEKIKILLSKFDAISVRDNNSFEVVKRLTHCLPFIHCDPVLHYDFKDELPKINCKKDYLVIYAHTNRMKKYATQIKQFAKKYDLKIICLMGYQGDLGTFVDATAFEVLAYIQKAKYVITTTFHGSVFSIKFNKKFVSIIQEKTQQDGYGNYEKVFDLLSRFHLESRVFDEKKPLEDLLAPDIDYKNVNEILKTNIEKGYIYIKQQILKYKVN